jgi:hypothetical protein
MAFLNSPGVRTVERDLTAVARIVGNSVGAFVGRFNWGPVLSPQRITGEDELVRVFDAPNDVNAVDFLTAANFLAYTGNMFVVRGETTGLLNAVAGTSPSAGVLIRNEDEYFETYDQTSNADLDFAARYAGAKGNGLAVHVADAATFAAWTYKANFSSAPGTSEYSAAQGGLLDEVHVVVVDAAGRFTGQAGTVLETYGFVSKARGAKTTDGANNYVRDVLNNKSKYVWCLSNIGAGWVGTPSTDFTSSALASPLSFEFTLGTDGTQLTDSAKIAGWSIFEDEATYQIAFGITGAASPAVANHVISIATNRGDFIAVVSPSDGSEGDIAVDASRVAIIGRGTAVENKLLAFRNTITSTSYAVMDSGFKYQYDRYADKYRWVPLNGDIAGLMARNDTENDPWVSPAGVVKGQIKNTVKLAYNPTKAERDSLYQVGINPVITTPGEGFYMFGDKTLLAKPSAFDRINVRRLFIVLRATVSKFAKAKLFEFNDSFTRAQFKNAVEPFLREVLGRRGITEFVVVCDESNNPGQIVDTNQFVADIFVKPNRAVNYITLSFIAARSDVDFSEIGG